MVRRLTLGLVTFALVVACSSSSGGGDVSKTIGPEGGTIDVTDGDLAGTQLVVPAGALAAPTTITIGHGAELATAGEIAVGPSVRLSPDGTTFATPATLRLPETIFVDGPGTLFFAVSERGAHSELPTTGKDAKGSTASIAHFSDYELVSVSNDPACEEEVKRHPDPSLAGDDKLHWFCWHNSPCAVCKDTSCGDSIGAGTQGGGCGGAFGHVGSCLPPPSAPPGTKAPILPGCIRENEGEDPDLPTAQRMCCANADAPAPDAKPQVPTAACQNACALQGASFFTLGWECVSKQPGDGCSVTGQVRYTGKDTSACDWFVGGAVSATGLEDVEGPHVVSIDGFPVGSTPLPVSLAQGQTCPQDNPHIGVDVKLTEPATLPAKAKCSVGGTTTEPITNFDLTMLNVYLCTECQTPWKDWFTSELGGTIYGDFDWPAPGQTADGAPLPDMRCQFTGSFALAGCRGGLCQ